jgi:CBS domain containing-hemolysin-like protein
MILYLVIALLVGLLTLFSHVEAIYTEMGRFLSREFQDNIEFFEQKVEPRLGVSRPRAIVSVNMVVQLTTAAIAFLLAFDVLRNGNWNAGELIQAAVLLVLIIVIFNRLIPFVLFTRTSGEWLAYFAWPVRVFIYLVIPATLILGFTRSVASLAREHPEPQPENTAEAVDALIEAGQEEGILEESDRELIQSVVEFGDKTVREVMTPRPEIVAVPDTTTVEQFTELLKKKPLSRVPVYHGDIDHIDGIVFAHDLLQVADTEARVRTVRQMMRPAYFVPETQRVSALLREMQRENVQMAVVIDEYGGVAGVVTMEDMVEEIVGEIRDEHEKSDVIRESDRSYIVPGSFDIDRLDRLFGVRPEGIESTTVAGLLSEVSGRIPAPGEVVEHSGLRFEVLDSTSRRIERLRVSLAQPRPEAPTANSRMRA